MGILRTRRVLRSLGLPTHGMKDELTNRLNEAISSGIVEAFVTNARSSPSARMKNGECASTLATSTAHSRPFGGYSALPARVTPSISESVSLVLDVMLEAFSEKAKDAMPDPDRRVV